jgi:N-glycosylase/DNA lyase
VERKLAADPVLRRHLPHTSGISILGQDPWEALASFVISQNNNIPKIRFSIERLCASLGSPIGRGHARTFPSPAVVADAPENTLRDAALGYRTPYLRAAARFAADRPDSLDELAAASLDDARQALCELPGVGEKVAECVLLYGLGHRDAFPVDVWVRRAVQGWYFRNRRRSDRDIRAFARDRFGDAAGLAQQHLFWAARSAGASIRSDPPRGSAATGPSAGVSTQRACPPGAKGLVR